jgi:glutathione S-transferase
MALTLYQYDISPFCDKVRRACHYKRLAYTTVEVLPSKRGAFKKISPTGKFPALADGGRIIIDSTNILDHLEQIAPEPSLTPASARDAALATLLEDWADESLYFFDLTMRNWPQNRAWFVADLLRHESGLTKALLGKIIPGALRKIAVTQGLGRKSEPDVVADLSRLYGALDALLEGSDFLAGPRLSRGDLGVFAMVFVLARTVEGKAQLEARPRLAAWFGRVDALTAQAETAA